MLKNFVYLFLIPAFFAFFNIVYSPFDALGKSDLGHFDSTVHIVLMACIILVSILISRFFYILSGTQSRGKWVEELLWYVAETVFYTFMIGMYISLFRHELYFHSFVTASQMVFGSVVYPYAICFLSFRNYDLAHPSDTPAGQETTIRFYDEHKKLKFIVSPQNILFIKADDNLIRITYIESGKVKEYPVRASMKSIETTTAANGIIRCHRSYFVNPKYVRVLRKDELGIIYADLNMSSVPPVPVSKKYYDQLADIL